MEMKITITVIYRFSTSLHFEKSATSGEKQAKL